jgi:hypothetical protein
VFELACRHFDWRNCWGDTLASQADWIHEREVVATNYRHDCSVFRWWLISLTLNKIIDREAVGMWASHRPLVNRIWGRSNVAVYGSYDLIYV